MKNNSTFAEIFLPEVGCFNFINVDLIAKGIAPLKPEKAVMEAGQIFLRKMEELAAAGKSFGFESTLSGPMALIVAEANKRVDTKRLPSRVDMRKKTGVSSSWGWTSKVHGKV